MNDSPSLVAMAAHPLLSTNRKARNSRLSRDAASHWLQFEGFIMSQTGKMQSLMVVNLHLELKANDTRDV